MAYPARAQGQQRRRAQTSGGQPGSESVSLVTRGLTQEQKKLIDHLQAAKSGVTMKQLECSLSFPQDVVRAALDDLMSRHLVCELNTIIPSYLCRYPGIRLYAD